MPAARLVPDLLHLPPFRRLSLEEERKFVIRSQAGDVKAQNFLIMNQFRHVFKIVAKLSGDRSDLEDLLQEGTMGLLHAIQIFDLRVTNCSLMTYATFWIRQYVNSYIEVNESIMKLRRSTVDTYKREKRNGIVSENHTMIERALTVDSLDREITNSDGNREISLLSLVSDSRYELTENFILNEIEVSRVRELVELLDSRSRDLLIHYYNLDGEGGSTMKALGKMFNISSARAQQIIKRALQRLEVMIRRSPDWSSQFESYIERKSS